MILADTSIWIEFLKGNPAFKTLFAEKLEQLEIVAAECVFGELLQGARDKRETSIILDYFRNLPHKNEAGLWLAAGELSAREKFFSRGVGLIDAFLVAFAKKHRTPVWTLDKKLLSVLDSTLLPSF